MHEELLIQLAGVGVLAMAAQWLAWWVKLPAILFLLLLGLLAGPVTGWLDPSALFGDLLFPFISLAVSVILFEGALTLHFAELRGIEKVVRNLVSIGLLVTWFVITLAAHYLVGFGWELSALLGAVLTVTGPTVIVPLLRTVRPRASVANILRWEGILIDPVGALLAVLVFEFIVSGGGADGTGHTAIVFGQVILAGVLLGALAGWLFGLVLRHHWLPEYLQSFVALMLVFAVFTAANVLAEESGLLAVTVMGMWLANMKQVDVDHILNFKESLSVLLISGLFIILAARVEFGQISELGWGAFAVFLVVQFIARPLKVWVATLGSKLSWQEKALLGWIAPRGIIAAAVTALFALRLQEQGYEQAALLVPMVFIVIIGTVVLQSATAGALARKLGVSEPDAQGFLIVGANPVAIAMGKALQENGFRSVLADTSWEAIRKARMEGLSVYYGNPVSAHADRFLNLVGLGKMLGMSRRTDQNVLAGTKYRVEFGRNNIYTLLSSQDKKQSEKMTAGESYRGQILFGEEITQQKLASLLSQGWSVKTTPLSAEFTFDDYLLQYRTDAVPLFAITGRGRLVLFVADARIQPRDGWKIIALVKPDQSQDSPDGGANAIEE
ncbi:sodium:proton antiporter [Granulosicoccaceae sp. 1_MG-2023]|nr:sodium:proton antiporter [Granulosicoccaceae sp. 1_MG-2023]